MPPGIRNERQHLRLWLVDVDFEEPCPVASLRMRNTDVEAGCWSLRDDEISQEELRWNYEIK